MDHFSADLDHLEFTSFLDAWIHPLAPADAEMAHSPFETGPSPDDSNVALTFSGGPLYASQLPLQQEQQQPRDMSNSNSGHELGQCADSLEGTTAPTTDRKTKVLEKNRRAQKKFRDRQKQKMQDMEAAVDELRTTLAAMTANATSLERQNEVLNKVLELRQNQIEVMTETAVSSTSMDVNDLEALGHLEAKQTVLGHFSVEQCRTMGKAETLTTWKVFVERIATVLLAAESPMGGEAAHKELESVVEQALGFAQKLSIVNQTGMKHLVVCDVETGQWDQVRRENMAPINSIDLSDAQKDKILHFVNLLQTTVQRMGVERERLSSILNQILPLTCGSTRSLGACIRAKETMDALQKNFEIEHSAWASYHAGVLSKVMTPLQFARFATASHPMFPNAMNVCKAILASGYQPTCPSKPFVLALDSNKPLPQHIQNATGDLWQKLEICGTET